MYLKQLRQKKHLSQEQLAENCKLSLRTVQRVEAGHRVGYMSLRALSAEFLIEIDDLERELYAMKNTGNEYTELPL
jgi:transcriptional regulator with XRE-family HTH domain